MSHRPRIFFIIGEHSGDLHASLVARELAARADVDLTGVAGPRMQDAGVRPVMRGETWGVMGIGPALMAVPKLMCIAHQLCAEILRTQPDVLVPVDFGAFNMRLLRGIRPGFRGKTLYYFPPRSWDRTRIDWRWMRPWVDAVATPFSWSAQHLSASGIAAEWVGHPVLDVLQPAEDRTRVRQQLGINTPGPVIGLLPGSRGIERASIGPQLLAAAQVIVTKSPNAHFLWSDIARYRRREDAALRALEEQGRLSRVSNSHDILRASDAALITMGTATLEAAAAGCPMLTVYAGTWAMWLQFRLTRNKPEFFAMPNLLAKRRVVPEFLGDAAPLPVDELARQVLELASDSPARCEQLAGLAEVRAALGSPGASARTAEMIMRLLLPELAGGETA